MEKPKKKYGWFKHKISPDNMAGYNQACDDWEKYHTEEMKKATIGFGCGGGWTYDAMRDCFTNQMGDIR